MTSVEPRSRVSVSAPRATCPPWCRVHEVGEYIGGVEEVHLLDTITPVAGGEVHLLVVQVADSGNQPSALIEFTPDNDEAEALELTADLPILLAAVSSFQGVLPQLTGGAQ